MNTRQAAKFAGITYRQLDYWITQGVITPSEDYGQGKARGFNRRDLVLLRLIAMLRADGYRIEALKDATGLVNRNWVVDPGINNQATDDSDKAGMLFEMSMVESTRFSIPPGGSLVVKSTFFMWGDNVELLFSGETISHMNKMFYSVKHIAKEVYKELDAEP